MMPKDAAKPNTRLITWGFTPILTFLVLMVTAVAAAYIAGVMSGRHWFGANTQELPPLNAALPVETPVENILKPGELDFAHVLKGHSRPVSRQPIPPAPEKPAVSTDKPLTTQEADTSAAPPDLPSPSTGQPAAIPIKQQGPLYDYVFQVAALKDEQAVDALRQELEGKGLRTRMERSGKVLLVLVLLRGDEARAEEVIAIAKGRRLGEPLLRSKKPVTP